MKDSKIIEGNCWVACCDLLGFKKRIEKFEGLEKEQREMVSLRAFVENIFETVTQAFEKAGNCNPERVFSAWFSDTFLFFAGGDSKDDFGWLNHVFREFCRKLISKEWPLRGAIGFGQLYADRTRNLFLGSGLINAHKYSEKKKQNWIGYIVTPEANNRLNELDVNLSRWKVGFTKYPVPFRQNSGREDTQELFVSKIHRNRPEVIRAVKVMQQEAMEDKDYQGKHRLKYENTLKFFEEHP